MGAAAGLSAEWSRAERAPGVEFDWRGVVQHLTNGLSMLVNVFLEIYNSNTLELCSGLS